MAWAVCIPAANLRSVPRTSDVRNGAGEQRVFHRSGCAEIKEVGRPSLKPRATRPEAWDVLTDRLETGVTTGLQTKPDAVSGVGHGTGPGLVDDEPGHPALSILAALRRPAKPAMGLTGQGAPVSFAISPARFNFCEREPERISSRPIDMSRRFSKQLSL
jgi:hypothetical protein